MSHSFHRLDTQGIRLLDRNLLFQKLDYVGIRGIALDWFKSYLRDRKQIVSILHQTSDVLNADYGLMVD